MTRPTTLLSCLAALALAATLQPLPAATIHIDYRAFASSELGRAMIAPILTGEEALDRRLATELDEILVSWPKRKAPPVIRYRGLPAEAIVDAHAGLMPARKTPHGLGATLSERFANCMLVATAGEDLLFTRTAIINDHEYELPEWPELDPQFSVMGTAFPADIKLTRQLKKHVQQLDLRWRKTDDRIFLYAHTPSHDHARTMRSYIVRRRPWIHFGSAIGFDALDFASDLLGAAKITVHDNDQVRLRARLDDHLRTATTTQLSELLTKQLDKYLAQRN